MSICIELQRSESETLGIASMQAWSLLWSLLLAFLDCFKFPYPLPSKLSEEKDSKFWMTADEVARSTGDMSNRVTKLEDEFSTLSSTCNLAAKTPVGDPFADRIKCLEVELAETNKV